MGQFELCYPVWDKHALCLMVEENKSNYRDAGVGFLSHLVGEVTCVLFYLKQHNTSRYLL